MSIQARDLNGDLNYVAGLSNVDMILSPTSKSAIANKTVYNALATKIESTVENLVNFYNKSQVYNKQEVRELIGAINTLTIEVVNELPTQDISATTIYFLKQSGANTYDEYIYVDNAWVKIGDTDIDLSGYLTTANFQIAIADYYTKSAIDAMIANYYTKTQVDAMVDAKQDALTFDNAPTAGSDNPVKSGGIKTALDAKQNTLTFDSAPTAGSSNPVTSGGIKETIDGITSVIPSSASSSNKLITIANGIKNFHAGDLFLHTIVADNPTIVDTQTLVKYIYDNYFAPTTNAQTDRVTVWMVNNPTDSLGRYTECAHYLASRYYDITLETWRYCRLVFEHHSFDSRLIVKMSPVGADMIPATCIWSAPNDGWGTSTELSNETGWYTEGGQSKWKQVASVSSIAAAGTTISLHYTALHSKAKRATMYGNNTIFNIDVYGANGSVMSYSGAKFNPTTDGKYGFTLTWNDYINNPTVCVIKYYVNNTATALNTSVSIQACVETHWLTV